MSRARAESYRAAPVVYTVEYRTAGSDVVKVASFRGADRLDAVAYARATAFMRGIDQSGGTASFPMMAEGMDR